MITFSINEKQFSVGDAHARQTLLSFLRENEFYDVKRSCEEGICGACSIIRWEMQSAACSKQLASISWNLLSSRILLEKMVSMKMKRYLLALCNWFFVKDRVYKLQYNMQFRRVIKTTRRQWCWWQRYVGVFMQVTDLRCWWQNHYSGDSRR